MANVNTSKADNAAMVWEITKNEKDIATKSCNIADHMTLETSWLV
jgi:hypothetical protein